MSKITDIARKNMNKQLYKDFFFICFGIMLYGFGYTAFILPEQVVMGGVAGISALLFYAFGFPPAISIWVLNVSLLLIAFRALTRQFTIRTIIGVSIMSVIIGALQPFFQAHPIITAGEDKFMHVIIGGAMSGAGLGLVFSHNGSTGGTDIIIALLNKHFRMSFGRAMQFIDITISYVCDYVINGSRQTVQFIIISKEYEKIADTINTKVNRGVTLIKGQGWYSKQESDILIVLARKYESQEIFYYIKSIDPYALVSQSFCNGVFGQGFDSLRS